MRILNVVGARPNFMKIAPLMRVYRTYPQIDSLLVHTGQHYDEKMSHSFFRELDIPEPDVNLEVGSASHAVQTAEIMKAFEPVVLDYQPDVVLVVGDVNSTVACGLVAVKLGVRLVHIEAGLRSFDRSMPEEINRVVTDSISELLFCTEPSGVENLLREGVSEDRIHLVGHVMIDTLLHNLEKAKQSPVLEKLGQQGCVDGDDYAVLTLHRPSNVDDPNVFSRILDALEIIQNDMPILFPIHPRTRRNLKELDLHERLDQLPGLHLLEPLGYLDFLRLTSSAKVVLTDSGGLQEETTMLKVPCITLRENTERPVTVDMGTNQIVGTDSLKIVRAYKRAIGGHCLHSVIPPLWDGRAAERIVTILLERFERPECGISESALPNS